ncbi:TRAP transporter small permease [Thalassovita mediterranea]|uniref:TRAP transporter small permease protein n=1 Tax=Thalassovita mediterranea TaxID=340021 RepID=A0A0P1GNW9_9RHOB|nr:TRAP transporter small permease [Thalassovita mediterranea]CUH84150.1 TRAP-type C4-dicarboxylate transport system, small permease component [Thalassovita mediterranea]SIS27645.1 TRAP-type C4-dicarboxylate transport system, small permease component [Thalassovita mediterranea]
MSRDETPPEIDFDALAAEDEAHFQTYKITFADYGLLSIFAALFGVVFLQFFTRYVLNDSVAWTEEAARYLLIILGFAGAIRCQAVGSHIALEFVDKYYGRKLGLVHLFALAASVVLFAVIIWSAYELIQRTSFQQMVSLPFPKYYLHIAVMVLTTGNLGVVAFQIVQRLKTLKSRGATWA